MSILSDLANIFRRSITSSDYFRVFVGVGAVCAGLYSIYYLIAFGRFPDFDKYLPIFLSLIFIFLGLSVALKKANTNLNVAIASEQQDTERDLIKNKTTELADMFHAFRIRMLLDSERLKLNSFKNLSIGIIFSIIALATLMYFVFLQDAGVMNYGDYIVRWFFPRISIVLLLQFVGFFFLRLYVASELDLKHNKNEITNVEAQIMSYAMAKEFGQEVVKLVVEKMATTERNFIIKNGEKSISVENESTFNDVRELLSKLVDKIPTKD